MVKPKTNKFKKLLALMLAFALAFGTVPVTAAANAIDGTFVLVQQGIGQPLGKGYVDFAPGYFPEAYEAYIGQANLAFSQYVTVTSPEALVVQAATPSDMGPEPVLPIEPSEVTLWWYLNDVRQWDKGAVTINEWEFGLPVRAELRFAEVAETDAGVWTLRAYDSYEYAESLYRLILTVETIILYAQRESPVVTTIEISPGNGVAYNSPHGSETQFTATAFDQFGNEMTGVTFAWSLRNAASPISDHTYNQMLNGLYFDRATGLLRNDGTFRTGLANYIRATANNTAVYAQIRLYVVESPCPIESVVVTPSPVDIEQGDSQQFTATAYDSDNNVVTNTAFWSLRDTAGNEITVPGVGINNTGYLTADNTVVPSTEFRVRATPNSINLSTNVININFRPGPWGDPDAPYGGTNRRGWTVHPPGSGERPVITENNLPPWMVATVVTPPGVPPPPGIYHIYIRLQGGTFPNPEPPVVQPPESFTLTIERGGESTVVTINAAWGNVSGASSNLESSRFDSGLSALSTTPVYGEADVRIVEAVTHTITFNPNGGALTNPTDATRDVADGDPVDAFPAVTRSGFTFVGWFDTDAATGGTEWTEATVVTADVTLYARWTEVIATVTGITTVVNPVTRTAYQARNAMTTDAIAALAELPASVSVTLDSGGTATLPITWATTDSFNAQSATYNFIGTLTGNANINVGAVTAGVTVTIEPTTAVNPTYATAFVLQQAGVTAATAADLGTTVLPTSGSIMVYSVNVPYTITWGAQTLDRTTVGNYTVFSGTIGYTAPAWLTLPSNLTVTRRVEVTARTPVIVTIDVSDKTFDGETVIATATAPGIPAGDIAITWHDTSGNLLPAAPVDAGDYEVRAVITGNSAITYVGEASETFTISQRTVTVTADSFTITAGEAIPALTVEFDGFIYPDNSANALVTQPVLHHNAPNNTTPGTFSITFQTPAALNNTNGANYTLNHVNATLTITAANVAPTITSANNTSVVHGTGGTFTVTATGTTPITFSLSGQPAGVSINSTTGLISIASGTAVGTHNFTITATNAAGTTTQNFALTVTAQPVTQFRVTFNGNGGTPSHPFAYVDAGGVFGQYLPWASRPGWSFIGWNTMQNGTGAWFTGTTVVNTNITVFAQWQWIGGGNQNGDSNGGNNDSNDWTPPTPTPTPTPTPMPPVIVRPEDEYPTEPDDTPRIGTDPDPDDIFDPRLLAAPAPGVRVPWVTPTPQPTLPAHQMFTDVSADAWYHDFVTSAVSHGLFHGMGGGIFAPQGNMTRAMYAQVLANLQNVDISAFAGGTRFDDVASDAWYNAAVEWAAYMGIVSGVGNNRFNPSASITREQMATMLFNFVQVFEVELPLSQATLFTDQDSISHWAEAAVGIMQQAGIISGRPGGAFDPQATATRAEVATIFARFLEVLADAHE